MVAVGASAGGLEAYTRLLRALPLDTGMGFVLVQHLDPDHDSALTDILSRATSLPVLEIVDDVRVLPNHVYVIPPNTSLTIQQGVLKLHPRDRGQSLQRPIDSFFESLAHDQGECAVGVVLSGTASDGTLGLEAIKSEGGITFAQDDSAQQRSMPRSAVAAGCVDLVRSPEGIAEELTRIAQHPLVARRIVLTRDSSDLTDDNHDNPIPSEPVDSGYAQILSLLCNHSGVDFSQYKPSTIRRRITRRMMLNVTDTFGAYVAFLGDNALELSALYADVLISVTSFFRNPETFDVLEQRVLVELVARRNEGALRLWVLGCSTGQEAYSLAMACIEAADATPQRRVLQVFATDLNDALLDRARQGLYPKSIVDEVTPARLRRFFVEEDGGYRVTRSLRDAVVFARHNAIADPPFSRMDLISCRNVMIYFEPSLQQKAIPTFHYALRPGGFLLLGASESIGGFGHLFEPLDKKHKIFARKAAPITSLHLPFRDVADDTALAARLPIRSRHAFGQDAPVGAIGDLSAERQADRITMTQYAPPAVLVNADLQVMQFRGLTSDFLEPPVGKASFDVLKMARVGIMLPLRTLLREAKKKNRTTRKDDVQVKHEGKTRSVSLVVVPLKHLRDACFLILFEEGQQRRAERRSELARVQRVPEGKEAGRIVELETELGETREYLQSMQEQLEAANDELQAANEEIQSANEELQSSNEELETSKEELESANEELTTVNEEISTRNVELIRLNNDLTNLNASAQLGIVLLGRDMRIRRFSQQAGKQLELSAADVGIPISHVRHQLLVDDGSRALLDLEARCGEVIENLREQEHEVRDRRGRWLSLRVRPYVTLDNQVDGAVIVLVDIDVLKRSERALKLSEARYHAMFDATSVGVSEIDSATGEFLRVNGRLATISGYRAEDLIGKTFTELTHPGDRAEYAEGYGRLIRGEIAFYEGEKRIVRPDRTIVWAQITVNRVRGASVDASRAVAMITDITERKRVEAGMEVLNAALRESEHRYRGLFDSIDEGFCIIEKIDGEQLDFRYLQGNPAFATQTGVGDVIGKTVRQVFPADSVGEGLEVYDAVLKSGAPMRFETTLVADARVFDVYAFRIDDQTQRRIAILFKDVTEHRRLERDLRRTGMELAAAAGRKNEFLAMLGHELRNPLSALAHGLALLGHTSDDRERAEQLRGMMVRQTERIKTLLDQLLDIASAMSGKFEIAKDCVDLVHVVHAAVEGVTPLLESQKHKLELVLPPENVALVLGDAGRLTQVVENLLTNAAKYTEAGGDITVTLEVDEREARIIVRDTGIGITAEFLPHIFELFTQGARALDRAKGGLGLGLPLVQRLLSMHDGAIEASSAGLHQGSEFVARLPRIRDLRPSDRPGPEAPHQVAAQRHRILVVDDERDMADIFASLLKRDGHEALAVNDGEAALAAIRTFAPDVVLLDVGLPGMDGYEVARRIREEHGHNGLLLIAVTGYQSDAARLKAAGFDHHAIKPPDMPRLRTLIAAWNP